MIYEMMFWLLCKLRKYFPKDIIITNVVYVVVTVQNHHHHHHHRDHNNSWQWLSKSRIITVIITTVTTSWLNQKSGRKRNLMAWPEACIQNFTLCMKHGFLEKWKHLYSPSHRIGIYTQKNHEKYIHHDQQTKLWQRLYWQENVQAKTKEAWEHVHRQLVL
jgi:hypothetical protein